MDNVINIKRKKLKTRKNLDELRRKSRGETSNNDKHDVKRGVSYKTNKLMTSQRLTLALNKKAVQSKVILRSKSEQVLKTPECNKMQMWRDVDGININNNSSDWEDLNTKNTEKPCEASGEEELVPQNVSFPRLGGFDDDNNISPEIANVEKDCILDGEFFNGMYQYINDLFPLPDEETSRNMDSVLVSASNENAVNELREQVMQSLNRERSVVQTISEESADAIYSYNNTEIRNANSGGDVSPDLMLMESIIRNSPTYDFYPHPLNL